MLETPAPVDCWAGWLEVAEEEEDAEELWDELLEADADTDAAAAADVALALMLLMTDFRVEAVEVELEVRTTAALPWAWAFLTLMDEVGAMVLRLFEMTAVDLRLTV